jgi:hypothetical protein
VATISSAGSVLDLNGATRTLDVAPVTING